MRVGVAICLCVLAAGAGAQDGGLLSVSSQPAGARLVINDIALAAEQTPTVVPVAAGVHRVRLLRAGYAPFEATVTVVAGETAQLTAQLEREFGRIAFDGLPPGATATVDGQPYDPAARLPVGTALVSVAIPGQRTLTRTVPVEAARETGVSVSRGQFRSSRATTAFLAPGLLQMRDGRRRGAVFAAAVVGGLATAGVMTFRAAQAVGDTAAARQRYDDATTEADAVAAREEWSGNVGAIRSSRQIRGGALVGAGLIYAVSLVDAFARHVSAPVLVPRVREFSPFSLRVTPRGAALAVRL